MSMTDPIADMLTRIRNGQSADKESVEMPSSKLKLAIAGVLESEGYIAGYETGELDGKPRLKIRLKYFQGHGVIENIERVSKPGLRVYRSKGDIPSVSAVSASASYRCRGRDDRWAREAGHGGELLCTGRGATRGSAIVSSSKARRPAQRCGGNVSGREVKVKGKNGGLFTLPPGVDLDVEEVKGGRVPAAVRSTWRWPARSARS